MPRDSAGRAEDRARAEAILDRAGITVSRETWDRLERYVGLLERWQTKTNLVAPGALEVIWTRHVADSLQLLPLLPGDARTLLDLGSGGGFPAIPLAAALADRPGLQVHLVESVQRKAAFLREVVRTLGLPATVHACRIKELGAESPGAVDLVTARALAPLPALLALAAPFLERGAVALFLKGRDAPEELRIAREEWRIMARMHPSITDPSGAVLEITGAVPTTAEPNSSAGQPTR